MILLRDVKGSGEISFLYEEGRVKGRFLCLALAHFFSIGEIFHTNQKEVANQQADIEI